MTPGRRRAAPGGSAVVRGFGRDSRANLVSVAVVDLAAVVIAVLTLTDVATPVRPLLTFTLGIVAPGMAVMVWMGAVEPLLRWVLSAVVGFSMIVLLAQAMVVVGWWMPGFAVAMLMLTSVASLTSWLLLPALVGVGSVPKRLAT